MENNISILVKNFDFASIAEFNEEVQKNKEELINYLVWRIGDGTFLNEPLPSGYVAACTEVLKSLY